MQYNSLALWSIVMSVVSNQELHHLNTAAQKGAMAKPKLRRAFAQLKQSHECPLTNQINHFS